MCFCVLIVLMLGVDSFICFDRKFVFVGFVVMVFMCMFVDVSLSV